MASSLRAFEPPIIPNFAYPAKSYHYNLSAPCRKCLLFRQTNGLAIRGILARGSCVRCGKVRAE